ncbi:MULTISPECIES: hypothetical protein [unclassified Streptomyces]|uniref:MFS transporter small subunit n=1 Tax=unclassified Streptomyces TaxID=2593676 RepID=UPI002DDAB469|nr:MULTISPECIES: hypothetical protein [unclassified Streptomyces]WSA97529.1 hypothetical protein OIE63_07745 [Streptomyces sp. NBC_01795]WSB81956.1 hypothetical protein OHB04_08565 [Streptomyces sp. NBC_01775]WSS17936.1 hypothetical protein OG533_31380 [Streptomyces sp. NBC_01186]WSS46684.1 hypothetical protein OG220_32165 [Streptomyces sp. NBC_01187]
MTPSNGVPPDSTPPAGPPTASAAPPSRTPLAVLAWLWVGLPLVYGLYELISKATQLFTD